MLLRSSALFFLLFSSSLNAADELERLVAEALGRNAAVAEARALSEAARHRVAPAAALPDPMVSLRYENDGGRPSLGREGMTRLELMAEQEIPFPGKRSLAGRIAATDADGVASRAARARLGVEGAVRRAYADLLLARVNRRVVEEQIGTWKEIEEVTRNRYAAGMGTQQDVLRAQAEGTRLLQQRVRDEAASESALAEISRLLERSVDSSEIVGTDLPAPAEPPSLAEALQRAEELSPELSEIRITKNGADLRTDLARRNLKPDFVASAAYMNRGGLPLMWSLGIGVSVPLWAGRKQAPLIAEAESLARASVSSEAAIRALLEARTKERLIRMRQLVKEAALDTGGLLVQDQLAVDAALVTYRTGGVPFVAVLEALGTLFVDRRAAASRLADLMKTEADLRELSLEGGRPGASASAPGSPSATQGM